MVCLPEKHATRVLFKASDWRLHLSPGPNRSLRTRVFPLIWSEERVPGRTGETVADGRSDRSSGWPFSG